MRRTARLVFVLGITLALQSFLVDSLPVFGARLDLWIVLAVAGGLAAGPDRGAAIGFICGLLFDFTQNGPIGLGALIYTGAGYLVGSVQRSVVGPARWMPVLAAVATTLAATVSYVALGVLLGEGEWLTARLVPVILVVTAGAGLLTPLAVRIMAWTEGEPLGISIPRGRSGSSRRPGPPTRRRRSSVFSARTRVR